MAFQALFQPAIPRFKVPLPDVTIGGVQVVQCVQVAGISPSIGIGTLTEFVMEYPNKVSQ